MKNAEILIPIWPNATQAGRLGSCDYGQSFGTDIFYFHFRCRPIGDGYEGSYEYRVWQNISCYVWISREYGLDIELKAYDVHSADLYELETLTKRLKWATVRLSKLEGIRLTIESLPFKLAAMCKALGIKRCIKYGKGEDQYAPVEVALQEIVAEAARRIDRMPVREVA